MFKPVANGPLPPPSPTKRLVLRLSAELARLHDSQPSTLNLIAEARTYLAQPEPQTKNLIQRLVEDLESWMEHSNCLPESNLLAEARLYLSLQELAQGGVKPIDQVVSSVKAQAE